MIRKHSWKKGFTLMETLLTVGIITILGAISVLGYHFLNLNLRQTRLDSAAQTIYSVAQNRLEELYANGRLEMDLKYGDEIKNEPSDWDESTAFSDYTLYYVSNLMGTYADMNALLFPDGSVNPEISGNKWIVEFDPDSGSIYSVYYSEDNELSLNDIYKDDYRDKSARKNDGAKVGYFGSGKLSGLGNYEVDNLLCDVSLINGEKLTANLSVLLPEKLVNSTLTMKLRIQNKDSNGKFVELTKDIEPTGTRYTEEIVLDSLETGKSFAETICNLSSMGSFEGYTVSDGSGSNLTPGDNIIVSLEVSSTDSKVNKASASDTANSTFANGTTTKNGTNLEARIAYGRHLQNLNRVDESKITNVAATQIDDIYLDISWASVYGSSYTFAPINKSVLSSYDGGSHIISGLTIGSQSQPYDGDAGLFSVFYGNILGNIRVVGEKIYASGNVGGIVGSLTPSTTARIDNCRVYLDYASYNRIYAKDVQYLNGANVGGLVGYVESNNDKSDITINNSFAATVIRATENAGGLLGDCSNNPAHIEYSYGACYLFGNSIGGLAGDLHTDSYINNCYAAGYQMGSAQRVAGFAPNAIWYAKNSYSVFGFETEYTLPEESYCTCKNYADASNTGNVYYIPANSSFVTMSADGTTMLPHCDQFSVSCNVEEMQKLAQDGKVYSESKGEYIVLEGDFTKTGSTQPYNMKAGLGLTEYPFAFIRVNGQSLAHYGDWVTDAVATGTIVYFEKYSDGTVGFFGGGTDALQDDKIVAWDGYALLYNNSEGNETINGILLDSNQTTTTIKLNLRDTGNAEQINIVNLTTNDNEYTLEDGEESYILKEIDLKLLQLDPAEFSNGFYQEIAVSIYSKAAHFDSRVTGYINPHFAKTLITIAPEEGKIANGALSIRSPRQLYNLSQYYDSYSDCLQGVSVSQETDLDYVQYDWSTLFNGSINIINTQPALGNTSDKFKGSYLGNYKKITGLSFSTNNDCSGFIGALERKCRIENLTIGGELSDNLQVNGVLAAGDSGYLGVMVGLNYGDISNCAVAGYSINADAYINSYVGGFVGINEGTITDCSASNPEINIETTNATGYVGSFAGVNRGNGTILSCYALTHITAQKTTQGATKLLAGGFIADNRIKNKVQDCYCATSATTGGDTENVTYFGFGQNCNNTNSFVNGSTYYFAKSLHIYDINIEGEGYSTTDAQPMKADLIKINSMAASAKSSFYCKDIRSHIGDDAAVYPYNTGVKDKDGNAVHFGEWIEEAALNDIGFFYWEYEEGGLNPGYNYYIVPAGTTSKNVDTEELGNDEISTYIEDMLCSAHDDGGVVKRYGYGYYVKKGTQGVERKWEHISNATDGASMDKDAKTEMEKQFTGYDCYTYYTQDAYAKSTSNGLALSDSSANGTFYIRNTKGGVQYAYKYTFSPFFAGAIKLEYAKGSTLNSSFTSISYKDPDGAADKEDKKAMTITPGDKGNQYKIRSMDQLQFINWNYGKKNACTYVSNGTGTGFIGALLGVNVTYGDYREFTYLQHSTSSSLTATGTQSRSNAENAVSHRYWTQSHDIEEYRYTDSASTGENSWQKFTPIAAAGDSFFSISEILSSLTSTDDRILWAWFGNDFNGDSFKIKNVNIYSPSYSVGLFGVTAGANIRNVILYSDNGSQIVRAGKSDNASSSVSHCSSYSIGGLIGVAYDYIGESDSTITNCAIAGYSIYDRSNDMYDGMDVNIGGLIGVTSANVQNCSAVVDIRTEATKTSSSNYNFIRIGGLVGSAAAANKDGFDSTTRKIVNCYTGGSISVSDYLLKDQSSTGTVNLKSSSNIFIGGIGGGAFTCNYRNFTSENRWNSSRNSTGALAIGSPYYQNCYTYMTLPSLVNSSNATTTIRSVSYIGSIAEQQGQNATLTIDNCYYLDQCAVGVYDSQTVNTVSERKYTYSYALSNYSTGDNPGKLATKNGTYTNYELILRGDLTYLYSRMPMSSSMSTTYNIRKLESMSYSVLSQASSKLGESFQPVTTVTEDGVAIDGKYSFPGNDNELIGENYPFPAIIKEDSNIWVHYGAWPKQSGIYSDSQDVNLDLMRYNVDQNNQKTFEYSQDVLIAFYSEYQDLTDTIQNFDSIIITYGDDKKETSNYQEVKVTGITRVNGKTRIVARVTAKGLDSTQPITSEKVTFTYGVYETKIVTNITADLNIYVAEYKQGAQTPEEATSSASSAYTFYRSDENDPADYTQSFQLSALTNNQKLLNESALTMVKRSEDEAVDENKANYYDIVISNKDVIDVTIGSDNTFTVTGKRTGTASLTINLKSVATSASLDENNLIVGNSKVDSNNTIVLTFNVVGEGTIAFANLFYDNIKDELVVNQKYDGKVFLKKIIKNVEIDQIKPMTVGGSPKFNAGLYIMTQDVDLRNWKMESYKVYDTKGVAYADDELPIIINPAIALSNNDYPQDGYMWRRIPMSIDTTKGSVGDVVRIEITLRYGTGAEDTATFSQYYKIPEATWELSLDANGGTWKDGSSLFTKTIIPGGHEPAYDLMNAPVYESTGKGVIGWFTRSTGGDQVLDGNGNPLPGVDGFTDSDGDWVERETGATLYAHWGDMYTLTLSDKDTGISHDYNMVVGAIANLVYTDEATNKDISYNEMKNELQNSPKHGGYRLENWVLESDNKVVVLDNWGDSVNSTYIKDGKWVYEGDVTLAATWTNTLLLKLQGDNGKSQEIGIPFTQKVCVDKETTYIPSRFDYNSYVLCGWYSSVEDDATKILNRDGTFTGNACAGIVSSSGSYVGTGLQLTLYAHYIPAGYILTLDPSFGTETADKIMENFQAYQKASVVLTSLPVLKYYSLEGWTKENDADTKVLTQRNNTAYAENAVEGYTVTERIAEEGDEQTQVVWEPENKTLKAKWVRNKFNLHLVLVKETSETETTYYHEETITDIEQGSKVSLDPAVFNEAVWLEDYHKDHPHTEIVSWDYKNGESYEKILNANGTVDEGIANSMIDTDGVWGEVQSTDLVARIQSTQFTVKLLGGVRNPDQSAAITQYWKEDVSVNKDGEYSKLNIEPTYTDPDTKKEMDFDGWYDEDRNVKVLDADGNPADQYEFGISTYILNGKWATTVQGLLEGEGNVKELKLKAHYEVVKKFMLHLKDGNTTIKDEEHRYNSTAVTETYVASNKYKTFLGWGTVSGDNSSIVLVYDADSKVCKPAANKVVEGLVANGKWTISDNVEEYTLYALWEGNKFDLNLDINEGKWNGTEESVINAGKFLYNSELQDITIAGYQSKKLYVGTENSTDALLNGWYTAADGGVKVLDAEGHVVIDKALTDYIVTLNTKLVWDPEGTSVTLYAHWDAPAFNVTLYDKGTNTNLAFAENYAGVATLADNKDKDGNLIYKTNITSRPGHTLLGWFTNTSETATKVLDKDGNYTIKTLESFYAWNGSQALWTRTTGVTLYAHWDKTPYTLTLEDELNVNQVFTVYYGEEASVNNLPNYKAPKNDNCNFLGWYSAKTGGKLVLNPDGTLVKNVTDYVDANGNWALTSEKTTLYARYEYGDCCVELYVDNALYKKFWITTGTEATLKGKHATDGSVYTAPTLENKRLTGWYAEGYYGGSQQVLKADGTRYSGSVSVFVGFLEYDYIISSGKWTTSQNPLKLYANTSSADYTVTLLDEDEQIGQLFVNNDENDLTTAGYYSLDLPTKTGKRIVSWDTAGGKPVIMVGTDGTATMLSNVSNYTNSEGKWNLSADQNLYAHWDNKVYTVIIDWSDSPEKRTNVKYGDDFAAINAAAHPYKGSTFIGLRINGELVYSAITGWRDTTYVDNDKWVYDEDDLEVKFSPDWNVTDFDLTLVDGSTSKKYEKIKIGSAASVDKLSGYTYPLPDRKIFLGWFDAASGGVLVLKPDGGCNTSAGNYVDGNGKWIRKSDLTLYAQYTSYGDNDRQLTLKDGNTVYDRFRVTNGYEVSLQGYISNSGRTYAPMTKAGYTLYNWRTTTDINSGHTILNADGSSAVSSIISITDWVKRQYGIAGEIQWNLDGDKTLYARWNDAYTITFHAENTDEPWEDTEFSIKKDNTTCSDSGAPDNPVRTGYDFDGWAYNGVKVIDRYGSLVPNTAITTSNPYWKLSGNVTVTALWTPKVSTVKIVENVNNIDTELAIISETYNSKFSWGTFNSTRVGYTFNGLKRFDNAMGWVTVHNGTNWVKNNGLVDENGVWTGTENVTLYASWSAGTFKLTLSSPDGKPTTQSLNVTSGTDDITFTTPTRTGYLLNGWKNSDNVLVVKSNGKLIPSIANFTDANAKWALSGNQTLYADWLAKEFTLTVDKKDGSASADYKINYEDTFTQSAYGLTAITRPGYIFEGWYVSGTKVIDENGEWVAAAKADYLNDQNKWIYDNAIPSVVFEAHWKNAPFTIVLDGNGGKWSTGDTSITVTDLKMMAAASDITLASKPTKNETIKYLYKEDTKTATSPCDLLGWYTESGDKVFDADGKLCAENTIDGLIRKESNGSYTWTNTNASVTLYAHWENRSYKLTLNYNGETMDGKTSQVVYMQFKSKATLVGTGYKPLPDKEGYTLGWYTKSSLEDKGSKVFKADGTANSTTTVSGWYSQELDESTGANAGDVLWVRAKTSTLYALRIANSISPKLYPYNETDYVTFKAKSGTNTLTNDSTTYDAFKPSRDGYVLMGWYTKVSGKGTKMLNADGTPVANVSGYTDANGYWLISSAKNGTKPKLYAYWVAKECDITLNYNGNGQDTKTDTVAYGSTAYNTGLGKPNAYPGCTFTGWTDSNGTVVTDADGAWIVTTYVNDGGWVYVNNEGTGDVSMTFTAQWDNNPFDLVLDANGGTWDGTTNTTKTISGQYKVFTSVSDVTIGGTATKQTTFSAKNVEDPVANMILTGWYSSTANDAVKVLNADGTVSSSLAAVSGIIDGNGKWIKTDGAVTLYAHWEIPTFKVILSYTDNNGEQTEIYNTAFGELARIVYDGQTNQYGKAYTAPTKTVEGVTYSISGWYTGEDGTGTRILTTAGTWASRDISGYCAEKSNDSRWTRTSDLTLYPKWEKTYTVRFEATDADSFTAPADLKVTTEVQFTLNLTNPTYNWKTFKGWYVKGDESKTIVLSTDQKWSTSYVRTSSGKTYWTYDGAATNGIITLVAYTEDITTAVTVDPANGDATYPVTATYGDSFALTIPTKVPTGYYFNGWKVNGTLVTNASGAWNDTTTYVNASGIWVNKSASVTFTADWKAKQCDVTLNYNGNGQSNATYNDMPYGDTRFSGGLGTPNTYTGYTFKGWKVGDNFVTNDKGEWTVDTYVKNGGWVYVNTNGNSDVSVTFVAQWENNPFTIVLDGNGGSWSGTTTKNITGQKMMATATNITISPAPTKTASFKAINSSGSFSEYKADCVLLGWYYGDVKVFNADGSLAITSTVDGLIRKESNGSYTWTNTNTSITLYAHWENLSFTLTLDYNGGKLNGETSKNYTEKFMTTATLKDNGYAAPTRDGYTLSNWKDNAEGSGNAILKADGSANSANLSNWYRQQYSESTGTNTGNALWVRKSAGKVYANWSANSMTLTLNPENTSSAVSFTATTATKTLTGSTAYADFKPTKNGYALEGWYTAKAGGGTKVLNADGTPVANKTGYTDANGNWLVTGNKGKTIQLYANWTANSMTVKLSAKSCSYSTSGTSVSTGTGMFTYTAPNRSNWTLVGWYTASGEEIVTVSNGTATLKASTSYTDASGKWLVTDANKGTTVTLIARWTRKAHKLTKATSIPSSGDFIISSTKLEAGTTSFNLMTTSTSNKKVSSTTISNNNGATQYVYYNNNAYIAGSNDSWLWELDGGKVKTQGRSPAQGRQLKRDGNSLSIGSSGGESWSYNGSQMKCGSKSIYYVTPSFGASKDSSNVYIYTFGGEEAVYAND